MKYTKPSLTFEQQVELLASRGLQIPKKDAAIRLLSQVSYYRLSAYCLPYQKQKDIFNPGTTFEDIARLYDFDRKLRFFVLSNLETIEIAIRCSLTYTLSHKYGPFGYLDRNNYAEGFPHKDWLEVVDNEISRSKERFIEHFRTKYHLSKNFPLWMASETFSFNSLSRMFAGLKDEDKKNICDMYEAHHSIFQSWLHSLCYVRNICAHHGRLWNKGLAIKPQIPYKSPAWNTPISIPNQRVFAILSIMNYLLKHLNGNSHFKAGIIELLKAYSQIEVSRMGFIKDWQDHQVWH